MISLRKAANDLDRLEELHRTAVQCFSDALHSTGQNAVELDATQAAQFRSQLEALRDRLRTDAAPRDLEAVKNAFAEELKAYRDKACDQVQRLRQEIQAATAAVESFAGSINESEVNLDSGIQRELKSLKKTSASDDIEQIRGAIHASTGKIEASIQQMRSSNQLAIAQLKDEIRLLHQEVQAARRSHTADPAAESRQRINGYLEEFVKAKTPFSVLLVVVRNLEGLQNCYSTATIDAALVGFQARFETILPSTATVGRWARDQFAAVLSTASSNAIEMSSQVVLKLSEPFVEQDKGGSQSIAFTPRAGVVDFSPGSDLAKLQNRLKQLAEVLAG
jgi:GGDEF domain-containing protein